MRYSSTCSEAVITDLDKQLPVS